MKDNPAFEEEIVLRFEVNNYRVGSVCTEHDSNPFQSLIQIAFFFSFLGYQSFDQRRLSPQENAKLMSKIIESFRTEILMTS